MPRKKLSSVEAWIDPDDAPELTKEWFDTATPHENGKPTRGRPKLATPKKLVSLRIDQDVLDGFRAGGRGWQSRINLDLRKLLATEKHDQRSTRKSEPVRRSK